MKDEFACGDSLKNENIDEDDIENLVIEQIEFCNMVILNKVSEVEPKELERIRQIVKNLSPDAEILECDYANVDLDKIINTRKFNYNEVSGSAGWIKIIEGNSVETDEKPSHDDDHHHHHDDDEHHHHHHDHDEDEGEAEEYGIGTYVYYNRRPFDTLKFNDYVLNQWPKNIIRAKGLCYFADNQDMSYIFETAGRQKKLTEAGYWFATASKEELQQFVERDPSILKDWDEEYGDRMEKIVFIGQKLDKEAIKAALDSCLF